MFTGAEAVISTLVGVRCWLAQAGSHGRRSAACLQSKKIWWLPAPALPRALPAAEAGGWKDAEGRPSPQELWACSH